RPSPRSVRLPSPSRQPVATERRQGGRIRAPAWPVLSSKSMVFFDPTIADVLLTCARRVVARGYIHNTLGNIAVRTPAAGFDDGVVYPKHAGVSLEDMTPDHVVVTGVPTGPLPHGHV